MPQKGHKQVTDFQCNALTPLLKLLEHTKCWRFKVSWRKETNGCCSTLFSMHGLYIVEGGGEEQQSSDQLYEPVTRHTHCAAYHFTCAFQTLRTNVNDHHQPSVKKTCPILHLSPSLSLVNLLSLLCCLSLSFILSSNCAYLFPATLIHSLATAFLSSVVRLSPSPVVPFTACTQQTKNRQTDRQTDKQTNTHTCTHTEVF